MGVLKSVPEPRLSDFTPVSSLLGGMAIGLSAVLLLAAEGRIAGVSGIVSRLLPPWPAAARACRIAFVAGLLAAPLVWWLATGAPPAQTVSGDLAVMALAGLAVGIGTVVGSGCTSGHGVCGLALLSPRSLVATPVFMAVAVATVFLVRHLA
ncbi:hypothetical protein OHA_1_03743 [Pleomorphomonas sp. SM30]|uniref:Sulphur transport domain-containing protein n=1 Tax=Oharaeibacter diazotrophicus TaxID=1920512 RepID=A0A4R6RG83_9HYPH|nr:hypothetical protein EDD54_1993 [Oharaeibacter diazotrophicus]BBE74115.1 hypothetical protein OHA_1_03743 [Pleomorphomonas sp. SM30]GLS76197.1 hypothetical protein GCM10007904_15320 [Oharaeibacter diazotrophicus]